jgi:7-cyano-7-deazaguanine synthase
MFLTFDYGQKGLRELDIARRIIEKLNTIAAINGWERVIEHRVIDMKFLKEL